MRPARAQRQDARGPKDGERSVQHERPGSARTRRRIPATSEAQSTILDVIDQKEVNDYRGFPARHVVCSTHRVFPSLRSIDGAWFLFVWGGALLISVLAAIGWTFNKLSGRSKTPEKTALQTSAEREREHRRREWSQRSAFQKVLWWFAQIWIGLVALFNLAAIIGSFIGAPTLMEGAARVQDMMLSTGTMFINLVLLSPAFGALWLGN